MIHRGEARLQPSRKFRPQILIGMAAGLFFEIASYWWLWGHQTAYSWAMLVAVPIVMGFAIGIFTETKWQIFWGIVLTLAIGIGFLTLVAWEGWICCVLTLPILQFFVVFGAMMGFYTRRALAERRLKKVT